MSKSSYAIPELCENWNNNIPLEELDSPELMLMLDSQDIDSICDNFPMLPSHEITGVVASIKDGDYSQVYVTESSRPYNSDAIYHPIGYYVE